MSKDEKQSIKFMNIGLYDQVVIWFMAFFYLPVACRRLSRSR